MKIIKGLFFIIISFWVAFPAMAQNGQKLPVDPKVRFGKLDNGLTYYIRHNAYPENRASFYIAQKVGSMQEEDNQVGLAHFLEHMAFNGTKNFPGRKTMLNYLEKQGAQFGKDVNAYTSFDETVYNLSDIPVVRKEVVDSCLLILHDWSGFLTLDNDEIDKERSIIKEEWRTRTGSQSRIWDKTLPILFEGSKYADRMPIGKMEVVENFEYQTLKDYYHKWYRPDLQGIIIVGDIDADYVEAKVKEMFSDIPMPVNPAERIYYPVADNVEPIVSIATDKEKTSTEVYLFYKNDIVPFDQRDTYEEYQQSIIRNLISQMLSARFTEISQKPDSPFTYAYGYEGEYFVAKTKDAWTLAAASKEGMAESTLTVLARENERMKRFGFTQPELDRAKAMIFTSIENSYNNRNKQMTEGYVQEYTRSFLEGEAIPGIEYEYRMIQEILPNISLEEVNRIAENLSSDHNIVISINGPEKEGLVYPQKQELINVLQTVRNENIAPYTEENLAENLLSSEPVAGKIIKEEKDDKLDATVWTLSNGAKVIFKKTDFKDDQIVMTSASKWGVDFYPDKDVLNAARAAGVMELSGWGQFSATDMQKYLSGKVAGAGIYIGNNSVGINGSSSMNDFETLLQLVYLKFTEPRRDEEAYEAFLERLMSSLKNAEASPYTAYGDSVTFARFGDNPRVKRMKMDDMQKLNYDRMIQIYKESFSDAGSFVFSFAGNIDEENMRPLVEKYIASLPSVKRSPAEEVTIETRKGEYVNRFGQEMENPKASVFNQYTAKVERNQKNELIQRTFKMVLDMVYTDKIREEVGGTYGVRTLTNISRKPEGQAVLQITFETDADKAVELNSLVHRELENMAGNGPDNEKFNKAKGQIEKSFEESIKQNNYWLGILNDAYYYHENRYSDYLSILNSITADDIRDFARKTLAEKNFIEVIMLPEAK